MRASMKVLACLLVSPWGAGCSSSPAVATGPGGGGAGGTADAQGGGGASTCTFREDGACRTVEDLTAGGTHTCAILDDATVRCWGGNGYGQLGDPSFTSPTWSKPRPVPGLNGVVELALGFRHSCARTDAGEVWCWGSNGLGELGRGTTSAAELTPQRVALPPVTDISARFSNTCAAGTEGRVWCWGFALDGQGWQGDVDVGEAQPTPTPVAGLDAVDEIEALVSGGQFACAAAAGFGSVHCWGANGLGQLGDGTKQNSVAAVPVSTDALGANVDLTAAEEHACVLDRDRQTIRCWGAWVWVEPIVRPARPEFFVKLEDATVEKLGAGWRYSCLRADDGSVRCWGINVQLQLGAPDLDTIQGVPTPVEGLPPATLLAVGHHHSCVRGADQSVWCWGGNPYGQLGGGLVSGPSAPIEVRW